MGKAMSIGVFELMLVYAYADWETATSNCGNRENFSN
jgi:hypothetical protein